MRTLKDKNGNWVIEVDLDNVGCDENDDVWCFFENQYPSYYSAIDYDRGVELYYLENDEICEWLNKHDIQLDAHQGQVAFKMMWGWK